MEMIQVDDVKVVGASAICMTILRFESVNDALQAILILATITYTVVRTVNEIKKFNQNKKYNESNRRNKDL